MNPTLPALSPDRRNLPPESTAGSSQSTSSYRIQPASLTLRVQPPLDPSNDSSRPPDDPAQRALSSFGLPSALPLQPVQRPAGSAHREMPLKPQPNCQRSTRHTGDWTPDAAAEIDRGRILRPFRATERTREPVPCLSASSFAPLCSGRPRTGEKREYISPPQPCQTPKANPTIFFSFRLTR